MEASWETIRKEYQQGAPSLPSDYQVDTEHHTLHDGTWDWHSYMTKGQVTAAAATSNDDTAASSFGQAFPETTQVLQTLRDKNVLFEHVPFGYAFFSTLYPHSRIAAHAAPMNFRIRIHLPLLVPEEEEDDDDVPTMGNDSGDDNNNHHPEDTSHSSSYPCGIRVGSLERVWIPGKALLLDDSYIHHVWNRTNSKRVVLLVDVWHPDVTRQERQDIQAMFEHAKQQGWWSPENSTTTTTTTTKHSK